jgi:hypothetical protein
MEEEWERRERRGPVRGGRGTVCEEGAKQLRRRENVVASRKEREAYKWLGPSLVRSGLSP